MMLISKPRLWEALGIAELLSKVAMLEETLLDKPRPQPQVTSYQPKLSAPVFAIH